MLVLTRQVDEEVIIGGNIRVLVVEIRGDKVRLAFSAPRHVAINRKEIQDKIDGQKNKHERPEPGGKGSDSSEES